MRADLLHVVGVYSNPRRYEVRARLLRQWVPHMMDSGVSLTLVEHAFGERPYEFSQAEFPHVNLVQVRGEAAQECWLQYALYNLGLSRLPDDAKYVCFQDTDIRFVRGDWAAETLHMLQHNRVGQTWTHAVDMDPQGNIAVNEWGNATDRSFSAAWIAGDVEITEGPYAPPVVKAMLDRDKPRDWRSHTGYSWAMRRETLKGLGRLPDWLIAGSSDWHMALGFCGKLRQMADEELEKGSADRYSSAYYRKLIEFAHRCDIHVQQDIGTVPGTILHGWHGNKKSRFYGGREDILTEAKFDPDRHVVYDVNGLPGLAADAPRALREGMRRYGTARNEDSIDV